MCSIAPTLRTAFVERRKILVPYVLTSYPCNVIVEAITVLSVLSQIFALRNSYNIGNKILCTTYRTTL